MAKVLLLKRKFAHKRFTITITIYHWHFQEFSPRRDVAILVQFGPGVLSFSTELKRRQHQCNTGQANWPVQPRTFGTSIANYRW